MSWIGDEFVELKSHEDIIDYIWDLINDSEVFNILSHEHNRNNHNSVDVGPDNI